MSDSIDPQLQKMPTQEDSISALSSKMSWLNFKGCYASRLLQHQSVENTNSLSALDMSSTQPDSQFPPRRLSRQVSRSETELHKERSTSVDDLQNASTSAAHSSAENKLPLSSQIRNKNLNIGDGPRGEGLGTKAAVGNRSTSALSKMVGVFGTDSESFGTAAAGGGLSSRHDSSSSIETAGSSPSTRHGLTHYVQRAFFGNSPWKVDNFDINVISPSSS